MIHRRELFAVALGGAALGAMPRRAAAQALESLKLFIPAAPAGGWDQTARSIALALQTASLVKNFQFENVAGAGGTVGLPRFINMRGQQNTLMVSGMVMVGAIIANKSPVNLTQVVPIARLTGEFEVVVVPAESPHKTMAELVAALKRDPPAVSWAGGSAGGTDHILLGMIAQAAGVDPTKTSYVAYSGGGPAVASILGNQVTAGVNGLAEFAQHIKAGKMRALAVSSEQRLPGLDVPTLRETGLDIVLANWRGVFAPPGIADAHRKTLTELMDKMASSAAWQEELKRRDWTGIYLAGDAFGDYVTTETTRIGAILRGLGLAT